MEMEHGRIPNMASALKLARFLQIPVDDLGVRGRTPANWRRRTKMQEAGNRWNDPRLAFLEAYSAELEREASAEDALRMRLNVILSDTAEALQSGPLSKDSWSSASKYERRWQQ